MIITDILGFEKDKKNMINLCLLKKKGYVKYFNNLIILEWREYSIIITYSWNVIIKNKIKSLSQFILKFKKESILLLN